jgi:hypothetical protein
VGVAPRQAGDEERLAVDDLRFLQPSSDASVHLDRLHEIESFDAVSFAHLTGCHAELLAKRSRERFVRPIADPDGEVEDVALAVGERAGGLGQAAMPHVTHDRVPGGVAERLEEVEAGHSRLAGDLLEPDLAFEVAFDVPDGFVHECHAQQTSGPRSRALDRDCGGALVSPAIHRQPSPGRNSSAESAMCVMTRALPVRTRSSSSASGDRSGAATGA